MTFAWLNDKKSYIYIFLLVMVLGSNLALYRSPISHMVIPAETNWLILSSLVDLAIISPILVLAISKKKTFSIKRLIILMAGGIILARFIIPTTYFEPFVALSYIGFAVEGFIVVAELTLLFMLVRYMPSIIHQVRQSEESLLFSFPAAMERKVRKKNPLIQILASEILMFSYAFSSWRKKPPTGERLFTIHKNSSLVAFQMMIIHAIIIETIGLHWWLHDKSVLLSTILLILNIYSVIYFIGDIHSVRLNPLKITDHHIYLSLGLAKKMVLSLDDIASITTDPKLLEQKLNKKTTIEFIAREFEAVYPHMILELRKPCRATLLLGKEKTYTRVALRMDDPAKFHEVLKEHLSKRATP